VAIAAATPLPAALQRSYGPYAGGLTLAAATGMSTTTVAAALVSRNPHMLMASAGVISVCAAFVLRPLWGLMLMLALRPLMDVWANTSLAGVSGLRSLNVSSLMAVVGLVVVGAFVVEQWRDVKHAPSTRPLVVFLFLAGVSVVTGHLHSAGITELSRYATTVILYLAVFAAVRTRRDALQIVAAILASAIPVIVIGLYQVGYGNITPSRDGLLRVHATFVAVDSFGIFMALICVVALPLVLTRGIHWRWMVAIAAPFALFDFVESYARTGWIATVVGVLIIAGLRYRWLLLAIPVVLVLFLIAVPSVSARFGDLTRSTSYGPGNTLSGRFNLWTENLPTVERNPITGLGFGYIAARPNGHPVHNDYVRAVVETGVTGLLCYLWLIWATAKASWAWAQRGMRSRSAVDRALGLSLFVVVPAWYLMSGTSNLMSQVVVAGVFWSLAACGHSLLRRGADSEFGYA
jgi:O-antigen ligase